MRHRPHLSRRALGVAVVLGLAATGCSGGDDATSTPTTLVRAGVEEAGEYRATVVRTGNDVAHVEGGDLGAVGFGQGWAAAEDHACTLADQVVTAAGERSRWFGAGEGGINVDSDVTMRALGVPERGASSVAELGPAATELMEGYVAGVRAWSEEAAPTEAAPAATCPALAVLGDLDVPAVLGVQYRLALAGDLEVLVTMADAAPDAAPDVGPPAGGDVGPPVPTPPGGTAWALGAELTETGRGTLLAHPLSDWEGATRLWENHLTVPGELEVYGASFVGVPVPAHGFNESVAYSPVPSPSPQGTAYRLVLEEGDPTVHLVDGRPEPMVAEPIGVEVLDEGTGELTRQRRTVWRSRFGIVVEPPGLAWSTSSAVAWSDAALAAPPLVSTLLAMASADGLGELQDALADGGLAWAATVAATADGRVWYGDTAATPALRAEAAAAHEAARATDPQVASAADRGIVLLDGSGGAGGWAPGADGGILVPPLEGPSAERRDYVVGGGSGSWLPHPSSPLHGGAPTRGAEPRALSPSHRQSVIALRDAVAEADEIGAPASLPVLQEALLGEVDLSGELLADAVVARCRATSSVEVPDTTGGDRAGGGATRDVELGPACDALEGWDRTFGLESRGALLWRGFLARLDGEALRSAGRLFDVPFREADPLGTPRGLAAAPEEGDDPVMVALGQAALDLDEAGIPLDAVLREVQWAQRGEERIPMHGGPPEAGSLSAVAVTPVEGGLRVDGGPSFLLAVTFTDDGPVAEALLAYGQSDRPDDPAFSDQTYRYSDRAWRPVLFRAEDVAADPVAETLEVIGPRRG
jgi:acyl-homoserine-lactone acylase